MWSCPFFPRSAYRDQHSLLPEPTEGRVLYPRHQQLAARTFAQQESGVKRSARPKRVEVQLAPMQPEDIEAVLAIEQQSFTMPWTEAMFGSELRNERTSHMLVARVGAANGRIVGYLGYRVVLDEMHVILLAVAPAWRQRGIARQMLCQ